MLRKKTDIEINIHKKKEENKRKLGFGFTSEEAILCVSERERVWNVFCGSFSLFYRGTGTKAVVIFNL